MLGAEFSGLSTGLFVLFLFCIAVIFIFEFINGFHDTANAVATVIYTKSLKPIHAVMWSGMWNFLGVFFSSWFVGLAIANKIANLLPVEALMGQGITHSAAMVLAVIVASIIWNLGTWYLGLPCSSSHTLIGSILGVGLVYSTLPENVEKVGVNWADARSIGESLLFSPLIGFTLAITMMFILRAVVQGKKLFKAPPPDSSPPLWIRAILITTCTLVSFFHGQNDGQKGVGLLLIVLMTFAPLNYALSPTFDKGQAINSLNIIEKYLPAADTLQYSTPKEIRKAIETIQALKQDIEINNFDIKARLNIRKRITILSKSIKVLLDEPNVIPDNSSKEAVKKEVGDLNKYTHYAPFWTIIFISIALSLGTMIGWKRIVITIGEKIGKRHMTYAEGASAELVAAATIGLSSWYGLPVSTTHVLSSGVAGSMVATKGVKNLQGGTIANIALAWVLTLPATIIISGGLYLFFRLFQ